MSGFSVATIDSPEFLNISSVSPLVSKCEIKVLYVGANRNRSFITKEVATEMAQTLPGCPIVGYYIENKEDFGDHGDQVIIDGEGIKFKTLTTPYGFVAPDSKIWFQKFEDTDEFGNKEVREYLMTEGYLWTGQFQECQRIMNNGNPQSMELDEKTLKGYWSTDTNKGVDFFIINDATFSKLCILGEDVEPCFEGASVKAPEVSSTFSKDDNFVHTLFTMIEELKNTLKNNEGGSSMDKETFSQEQDNTVETPVVEFEDTSVEFAKKDEEESKESESKADSSDKEETEEDKKKKEDYACADKDDEKKKDYACGDKEEEDKKKDFACSDKDEEDDKKKYASKEEDDKKKDDKEDSSEDDKKDKDKEDKYSLMKKQYTELQEKYSVLEAECVELRNFKNQIEDKQKDELIDSFYMLSDDDKKDVIENKAKYSLDDIEAKLSVICVRKKVSFIDTDTTTDDAPVTFNLEQTEADVLPAWLRAVAETKKRNS